MAQLVKGLAYEVAEASHSALDGMYAPPHPTGTRGAAHSHWVPPSNSLWERPRHWRPVLGSCSELGIFAASVRRSVAHRTSTCLLTVCSLIGWSWVLVGCARDPDIVGCGDVHLQLYAEGMQTCSMFSSQVRFKLSKRNIFCPRPCGGFSSRSNSPR